MKRITEMTVTYEDGSTETFTGPGHIRRTDTYKEVERPEDPKRTDKIDVKYVDAMVSIQP